MSPPEFDEVRWRWMGQRIRATLEEESRGRRRPSVATLLGPRRPSFTLAAGAVAVVVAGVALLHGALPGGLRLSSTIPDSRPSAGPAKGALELRLDSGAELWMSPDAKVLARSPSWPNVDIELESGELDVRLPLLPGPEKSFTVRTPAYIAVARATDFSLGYRATDYFVTVREGEVEVRGGAFPPGTVVTAGQSRMVHVVAATSRSIPVAKEEKGVERGAGLEPASSEASAGVSASRRTRPSAGSREDRGRAYRPSAVESREGETSVVVMGPKADPIADAWLRASAAYYEARDLEAAIQIASAIARDGGSRPEARLAEEMLCEAYIATHQPRRAVESCARLLQHAPDGEAARAIEHRLATIYRSQLSDCRSAVLHYGRAMVFGRRSMLDDEALLGRASCFLELGDLASARSDLAILESRKNALARPLAYVELRRKLDAIMRAAGRNAEGAEGQIGADE